MPLPFLPLALAAAGKGMYDRNKADKQEQLQALLQKEQSEKDIQMISNIGRRIIQQVESGNELTGSLIEKITNEVGGTPQIAMEAVQKLVVPTLKASKEYMSPEKKLGLEAEKAERLGNINADIDVDKQRRIGDVRLEGDIKKAQSPELQQALTQNKVTEANLKTAASLDMLEQKIKKIAEIGAKEGWTPEEIKQKQGILVKEDPFAKLIAQKLGLYEETPETTQTPQGRTVPQASSAMPPVEGNENETLNDGMGNQYRVIDGRWKKAKQIDGKWLEIK